MITQFQIDCALMAGASYISTRPDINKFPVPQGWTEQIELRVRNDSSGFEATTFKNGNEVVISYAGTNPNSLLDPDNAANLGLATGFGSDQLLQAAEYYLQVKALNTDPNVKITLTGHSLGGGLAALVGVFFGVEAVTFDQAPFANSAELSLLHPDVAASLKNDLLARGYSEADLSGLTNFLQLRQTDGGIPNSNLVTTFRVTGEFTSSTLPFSDYDAIGAETPLTHGPADWFGVSFDLHAQSLLTTFVQNDQFRQVTFKLTDLLGMIFDDELFEHPTNDPNNENFLERLVRHQNGNVPGVATADAMLDRFTNDLWKLAQDGGLTIADDPTALNQFVSKTLTAFAMQMYYEDTANATNANKELFTEVTDGVQFDRLDVAATLDQAKGYNLYFQTYLSTAFTDNERQLIQSLLPTLRDWYVQAGSGGMNVADAHNRGAFILGGNNGSDNLTGGTQADLLVGNTGADQLAGGLDNDLLLGGVGFDTYIYTSGDGNDTIEDADGRGAILIDNQLLVGGTRAAGATDWVSPDGRTTFQLSGGDLSVTLADGSQLTVNQNFQSGQLGIRLVDLPAFGAATRTEFLKVDHYEQVGTDQNGNPIYEPVYAPFFDEAINSTLSGQITPPIGDENNLIHALGSNDYVVSGTGNDQLFGDTGDDQLFGGGGQDRLYGGDGNDILSTLAGNDVLEGGAGQDVLIAGWGDDVLIGGTEDDLLFGDSDLNPNVTQASANDFLDGGDGKDELHGGAGSDVLVGGAGNDLLVGDFPSAPELGGDDILDGGAGDDQLFGISGDDLLSGGAGNDQLNGQGGNDILFGGEGQDTLSGDLRIVPATGLADLGEDRSASGNDFLDGGAGIDFLYGGEGNDVLLGGAGDDVLFGVYNPNLFPTGSYVVTFDGPDTLNGVVLAGGDDVLDGGDGDDALIAGDGDDVLFGGAGDDQLGGGDGADLLYGEEGADALFGHAGDDFLDGGAGNDRLFGSAGADTLLGGDGDDYLDGDVLGDIFVGDDVLDGGAGDDTYVVNSLGDAILEAEDGGLDTVVSSLDNYVLPDNLENLTMPVGLVGGLFTAPSGIGNASDNVLRGAALLDGRGGNDTLIGTSSLFLDGLGLVHNTYVFGRDYGQDLVLDFDAGGFDRDTVQMAADVLPSELEVARSGNDLVLSLTGSDDQLTVQNHFAFQFNDRGFLLHPFQIEQVRFADGTLWDLDTLQDQIRLITGTEGDDSFLSGNSHDNVIRGLGGNDILEGLQGEDLLDGGPGADSLSGGEGSDTYVFGRSSDGDNVYEFDGTEFISDVDTIRMETGVLPSEVSVQRSGQSLVLSIGGTAAQLTVQEFFSDPRNQIEQVAFGDGTHWDAATLIDKTRFITGTDGPDVLQGYELDDVISGLGGDDFLNGGFGADTLAGGSGDDTYVVDNEQDVVSENPDAGTDTVLSVVSYSLPEDVENLRLIGSTGLTGVGNVLDNVLTGNSGDNVLVGGLGNDTLNGGIPGFDPGDDLFIPTGDDLLTGGPGNDTYLFGRRFDHDTIQETDLAGTDVDTIQMAAGVAPEDIVLHADPDDGLVLQIAGTPDLLTVSNFFAGPEFQVDQIAFADGTVWDSAAILSRVTGLDVTGTEEADILRGTRLQDTLTGGAGNDTLLGGAGDDAYLFNLGDGVDTIQDTAAPGAGNEIRFGSGIGRTDLLVTHDEQAHTLTIAVGSGGDAIQLTGFDPTNANGSLVVETLAFADGSSANLVDLLGPTSTAGDDVITTGGGNDVVDALGGNDTVSTNGGNDTLTGGTGNDTLDGGTGDDRYIYRIGDGLDELTDAAGQDTVAFGVGISFATTVIRETTDAGVTTAHLRLLDADGNELADQGMDFTLGTGGASPIEHFEFADGTSKTLADLLIQQVNTAGSAGNDTIQTGRNDDLITAGNGNDQVFAGSGHDTVSGGSGADQLFGDAGHDTLTGDAGDDSLDGGFGNDVLDGGTGNDTLLGGAGFDTLRGQDGDDRLDGGAGDDLLDGGSGADTLIGGMGNDVLQGGKGNDTYQFGRGDGVDTIQELEANGGGTDRVQFGSTLAPLDLVLSRSANDLRMAIHGSADALVVQDWYSGASHQTEELRAGNGQELLNTQVDQLIQAMASYSQTSGLSWDQAIAERPQEVQAVLAAHWHAPQGAP